MIKKMLFEKIFFGLTKVNFNFKQDDRLYLNKKNKKVNVIFNKAR